MNSPVTLVNRHPRLRPAHRLQEKLAQMVFAGERKKGTADIILADAAFLRTLNRRYRKKNKTTDVLSFSFGEPGRSDESGFWGEIYINLDMLRTEAGKHCITLKDALALRVVHGLLHLFGYDHEKTAEGATMAAREARYLKAAGFTAATFQDTTGQNLSRRKR